ncbi:hypothetical protein ACGGAI_36425 [Streptomyces antibioticus]
MPGSSACRCPRRARSTGHAYDREVDTTLAESMEHARTIAAHVT